VHYKLTLLILCLIALTSRSGFAMAPKDGYTQIILVKSKNKDFEFEVKGGDTIESLKNWIEGQTKILPKQQRIVFCGRELSDEVQLSDPGLQIAHTGCLYLLEKPTSKTSISNQQNISKDLQPKNVEQKTPIPDYITQFERLTKNITYNQNTVFIQTASGAIIQAPFDPRKPVKYLKEWLKLHGIPDHELVLGGRALQDRDFQNFNLVGRLFLIEKNPKKSPTNIKKLLQITSSIKKEMKKTLAINKKKPVKKTPPVRKVTKIDLDGTETEKLENYEPNDVVVVDRIDKTTGKTIKSLAKVIETKDYKYDDGKMQGSLVKVELLGESEDGKNLERDILKGEIYGKIKPIK
jgi:ubiquitin domain-containing protein